MSENRIQAIILANTSATRYNFVDKSLQKIYAKSSK